MKVGIGIGFTGIVRVEKGKGQEVTEKREFQNVVLNVGWEHFLSKVRAQWGGTKSGTYVNGGWQSSDWVGPDYLFLGTGTSEPKATDAGLQSISPSLGSKFRFNRSTSATIQDPDTSYTKAIIRWDYTEGEAEGVWTELGTGFHPTYISPFNRALFRNENGDPISITVLQDEWLRVFVELRIHIDVPETVLHWNLNGDPVTSTLKFVHSSFGLSGLWGRFFDVFSTAYRASPTGGLMNQSWASVKDIEALSAYTEFDRTPGVINRFGDFRIASNAVHRVLVIEHNFQMPGENYGEIVKKDTESLTGSVGWSIHRGCVEASSGTATGATATTLTDAGKAWDVNAFQHKRLIITGGTGEGQEARIVSNTGDTITVEAAWGVTPDATSTYRVCLNG